MSDVIEFKTLLAQIDAILDQCRPDGEAPTPSAPPSAAQRAHRQDLLQQAVEQITEGLALFPFNPQLLRRRSWARANLRTADGVFPEMHRAVEDLQLLLEFDPGDLASARELLESMNAVGGMPPAAVADVASELSSRTEDLLIQTRILQMRALLSAGVPRTAGQLYDEVSRQFSDSSRLRAFRSEILAAAKD